jgi:hypothetical protein
MVAAICVRAVSRTGASAVTVIAVSSVATDRRSGNSSAVPADSVNGRRSDVKPASAISRS